MRSRRDRQSDPRRRITPDDLAVVPELLGFPLAGHVRRVAATVADIALVALLSHIGWGALFFTVFTTVWQGRTPGKRILGLRVVRLDGSAITCGARRTG